MTKKLSLGVVAALLLAMSGDLGAKADTSKVDASLIRVALQDLRTADIAVEAGNLVKLAPEASQSAMAVEVARQVLQSHGQLAVQLVASIAKAAPKTTPSVTAMAVAMVPQYSVAIMKAALAVAPQYAVETTMTLREVFPSNTTEIMGALAALLPEAATKANEVIAQPERFVSMHAVAHGSGGVIKQKKVNIAAKPFPKTVPKQFVSGEGNKSFDEKRYD